MKTSKVPMRKLVLENCRVTIRVPIEMLGDDAYTILIEDANGLVLDQRGNVIEWDYDQDFLFAVKKRLEVAQETNGHRHLAKAA